MIPKCYISTLVPCEGEPAEQEGEFLGIVRGCDRCGDDTWGIAVRIQGSLIIDIFHPSRIRLT